jgi:hypothetical protein
MDTKTIEMYDCSKYMATKDTVKDVIKLYGVAIVPNVLSVEECDKLVRGFWDYIETKSAGTPYPVKRDNKSTWRNFWKFYPIHGQIIQHFGIGHAQFLWDLRQNPSVAEIFAIIWDCTVEDLLVSFDGASLHLPPETTRRGWFRHTWMHVDQSYTDSSFKCVQGSVNGLDNNVGDATFSFLEGSHLLHKDFGTSFGITNTDNWYKLNEEQQQWYMDHGTVEKRVTCPRGSLILWDSRTVHCGIEALRTRTVPNMRCVGYVCYQRRDVAKPKDLKRKRDFFEAGRTTSHWAATPKLFGKVPRTYGAQVPVFNDVPAPVLTDLGRKLAGY